MLPQDCQFIDVMRRNPEKGIPRDRTESDVDRGQVVEPQVHPGRSVVHLPSHPFTATDHYGGR
jgi:hypothetical protein